MSDQPIKPPPPRVPAFGVLTMTVHGSSQQRCLGRAQDIAHQYFDDPYKQHPLEVLERSSSPVLIDGIVVAYRAQFSAWIVEVDT